MHEFFLVVGMNNALNKIKGMAFWAANNSEGTRNWPFLKDI